MTKKEALRRKILSLRKALDSRKRKELSRRIADYLIKSPHYRNAQKILLYASFGSEVETDELLAKALEDGKEVYLPRTLVDEKRLSLHRVFGPDELRPGAYGIPEPPPENPTIDPAELDLIVTPGVAFDPRGGRLGYGGGYYDRLFTQATKAKRVALAFSCQLVDELPLEPHDVRVHAVVTEKGLLEVA
ncbi:MAG: 5-formyltetrahydrofolate cyclo-ligase [Thermodesulfobacteria bacterium]|nr:5-formyltetrahydrofolate cyclo-ligase [Thermodesulfobacteriota bacterium]